MVRAVWQNEVEAQRFMNMPHPELGGGTPLERAMTESGAREVEEVIERGQRGCRLEATSADTQAEFLIEDCLSETRSGSAVAPVTHLCCGRRNCKLGL